MIDTSKQTNNNTNKTNTTNKTHKLAYKACQITCETNKHLEGPEGGEEAE